MFTILQKNFGGRVTNRYFKDCNLAREELEKDVAITVKRGDGHIYERIEEANKEKGFFVYEVSAFFKICRESCTWSLLDGFFEDENNH